MKDVDECSLLLAVVSAVCSSSTFNRRREPKQVSVFVSPDSLKSARSVKVLRH